MSRKNGQAVSVPEGYKMTEVGVIPEEWKVVKLGSTIESLEAGVSVRSVPGTSVHRSGTPSILKTSCVSDGRFFVDESKPILPDDFARVTTPPVRGSMIVSRMNTIDLVGECGYVGIDTTNTFLPDRLWLAVPSKSMPTDMRWLTYLLSSRAHRDRVRSTATGTSGSMKNISKSSLLDLVVPYPPLPEQRAIATALTDTDDLIESLERVIAKKRRIKEGVMGELLSGERRLEGFEGEWKAHRLRDLLEVPADYGINAPASAFREGSPAYLRITDISDDGRFRPDSKVGVRHPAAEEYRLREGQIVFARTGASTGKAYLYRPSDGPMIFAGFLIRVIPDPNLLMPSFLFHYTQTEEFFNWVQMNSMRSGQPGINGKEYGQLSLLVPPLPEQHAIATLLTDMDEEIEALEGKLAKVRRVKEGMMGELLGGRVRLV